MNDPLADATPNCPSCLRPLEVQWEEHDLVAGVHGFGWACGFCGWTDAPQP